MKLGIMQPYFFPYIGYFQLIKSVDKYILYDNLNFIKYGWINRNNVIVKKSGKTWITVPLKSKSSFIKIKDTEINNCEDWRGRIKKTLFFSYHPAPMFNKVFPLIEELVDFDTNKISDLNRNSIIKLCKYLNIYTEMEPSSEKYQYIEDKLNHYQHKNIDDTLQDQEYNQKIARIIEFCKVEKADTFINAIGGINLYPKGIFQDNNIRLYFVKTKPIIYRQFTDEFIPNLSIIDVMMFNSRKEIREILNQYELV